mmetsp:Transcript_12752/g.15837  ORF Transcript_12752/g.15837 Transcript_12752/m.15837 type:complete len:106 (+) Transcript_12752:195-512(+)|eukprot:CAMPEP_0204856168 /NCGR_PEP_ID=MMETSP1347-20130617/17814_1 /ASSEMBLY_ACC=CAM_ASM_000690 /TAXON_ID=215587 /ORGANISM="Aplanochytrium stocchinoi, Strain GSBS06" /LENGTH=105 /DNA_ID=CAMNT_0052002673 /DNA_START=54 /DNA_END=371 /DNA_ORIENTATION=-
MPSPEEALEDVKLRGNTFFKLLESPVPTIELIEARTELKNSIEVLKAVMNVSGVSGFNYVEGDHRENNDFEDLVRKKENDRVTINNNANAVLRAYLRGLGKSTQT